MATETSTKGCYLLITDGSKYAVDLRGELVSSGIEVRELKDLSDLESMLCDDLTALVLVGSSFRRARTVRRIIAGTRGSAVSRVPVLAALESDECMEETDDLKYVDDFALSSGGPGELIARVELLGVRMGMRGNVISLGELLIDLDAHTVLVAGVPVDLTFKEFMLLKHMASSPNRAFSRGELLQEIWGFDYLGGTRTVDVHIRRLRSKVERSDKYIETVHGVGYRFKGL